MRESGLPGVRLFLSRIVDDLAQGRSVIVAAPLHAFVELEQLVLSAVDDRGCFHTECFRVNEPGEPLAALCRYFNADSGDFDRPGLVRLMGSEDFAGRLVVVENLEFWHWPKWRGFLRDYSEVCRQVPEHSRTVFLACLEGMARNELPKQELTLRHHVWDDFLSSDEVRSFSAHALRARGKSPQVARLLASVVAAFAQWDLELAEILSNLDDWELFAPEKPLRATAEKRGWTPDETEAWELGTLGHLDGHRTVHSGIVALREDSSELATRLWTGQIGVLMPRLEQERTRLINRYGRYLDVPFDTRFGTIESRHHLELNHIRFQLQDAPIPQREKSKIEILVRVRNNLAHQEPADFDDLKTLGFLSQKGSGAGTVPDT